MIELEGYIIICLYSVRPEIEIVSKLLSNGRKFHDYK
jgi:hypothetical protein